MKKEIKSPLSDEMLRVEAVFQIETGIMQQKFALAYMQKQLAALPIPADDAPEEEKQAYAKEKVKVDAKEAEIERQEAYRQFISDTFHV